MTVRVEWFYELESGFLAPGKLAGSTFQSEVAGQKVTVHLPSLPDSERPCFLGTPTGVALNGSEREWGSVLSSSGPTVHYVQIDQFVLSADLPEPDAELLEASESIVAEMDSWWDIVKGWLEVLTGQHLTPVGHRPVQYLGNHIPVWKVLPDGSLSKPLRIAGSTSVTSLPGTKVPLATDDVLKQCFAFASANTAPEISWLLIRDARSLHEVGQYRRAVIDAGGAAEMAVKALLDGQLLATVPPGIVDYLTQRDLTLGTAAHLLTKTGFTGLPANFSANLVAVRNRATHLHRRTAPAPVTEHESWTAISLAAAVVELASPLPGGVTRLWS
ncbi:hypothetical protein [Nocardia cyriacigeorgica]|uniref:hypothetical protein n=1 Tax=Nocardia cyriacigeorgica TaxID=135487 RepID=UPI0034DB19D2